MNILLLTQYFPPETGAPQNRIFSLAKHLQLNGFEISVVTANPSYPKSEFYAGYEHNSFNEETLDGIKVHRCPIYVSSSRGILSRLLNYFSFVFTSLYYCLFIVDKHDILICESPPLFLGITAVLVKWVKGSKLVFNVSDLWPKTAEELQIINNKFLLGLSYKLEKFLYKQSALVSGQTQGIVDDIKERFPKTPLHLVRNGIDPQQFSKAGDRESYRNKFGFSEDYFVITYAGIIGHAQGFEVILDAAEILLNNKDIKFLLVGDGPVKNHLLEEKEKRNLSNIIFTPSIPREQMPDVIAGCDCYVTPLRKNNIFLGAIPSKVFEPLYYGKPAIMGVNGEAYKLFVEQGKCALHFEPENAKELSEKIILLKSNPELKNELGANGKKFVIEHFNRATIAKAFADKLKDL